MIKNFINKRNPDQIFFLTFIQFHQENGFKKIKHRFLEFPHELWSGQGNPKFLDVMADQAIKNLDSEKRQLAEYALGHLTKHENLNLLSTENKNSIRYEATRRMETNFQKYGSEFLQMLDNGINAEWWNTLLVVNSRENARRYGLLYYNNCKPVGWLKFQRYEEFLWYAFLTDGGTLSSDNPRVMLIHQKMDKIEKIAQNRIETFGWFEKIQFLTGEINELFYGNGK